MISEGDRAPDFTLPGVDGDDFEEFTLYEHTESGAVVLVFYPFDFSPVCTDELCMFRDAEWLTVEEDVEVFAISLDSCYAHREFMDKHDLSFPLLSDTVGNVSEEYGLAYDVWEDHTGVPKRSLVTIDDSQTVQYCWKTEDANEKPSLDELHEAVTSLVE